MLNRNENQMHSSSVIPLSVAPFHVFDLYNRCNVNDIVFLLSQMKTWSRLTVIEDPTSHSSHTLPVARRDEKSLKHKYTLLL